MKILKPLRYYYKILQINSNVDKEEIKRAYKKLALKWHPVL